MDWFKGPSSNWIAAISAKPKAQRIEGFTAAPCRSPCVGSLAGQKARPGSGRVAISLCRHRCVGVSEHGIYLTNGKFFVAEWRATNGFRGILNRMLTWAGENIPEITSHSAQLQHNKNEAEPVKMRVTFKPTSWLCECQGRRIVAAIISTTTQQPVGKWYEHGIWVDLAFCQKHFKTFRVVSAVQSAALVDYKCHHPLHPLHGWGWNLLLEKMCI